MVRRKKQIAAVSLISLAFLVIGLALFTFRLSRDITDIDRERSLRTAPLAAGTASERIRFKAADGIELAGLWVPAKNEQGVVVLCHGRGSGKGWFLRHGQVAFLHDNHYSCLLFDFRGTGESGGRYCTLGDQERLDLHAAIKEARKRSAKGLALWGVSMGAATAILAGAEDPDIHLIIAESSYDSFEETVAHHQKLNYHLPRWPMTQLACWLTERRTGCRTGNVDMVEAASRITATPLLLVHCENDVRTPEPVARRIFAAAAGPKELFIVPEASHGEAFASGGERYHGKLLRSLEKHLTH